MIIVSGSMRSGTSLMCQILQAIGLTPSTDNKRKPDKNNPNGYFEIENIGEKITKSTKIEKTKTGYGYSGTKNADDKTDFIESLDGDFVKIISVYIESVPKKYPVIFMVRNYKEIADSIGKFRGKDLERKESFEIGKFQEEKIFNLSDRNIVYIDYNDLMENPEEEIEKLKEILGEINVSKAFSVIDKDLYRSRK